MDGPIIHTLFLGIRNEQLLSLLPLVSSTGWVPSRVIKLPPARACLQLAPQHYASTTSKLPKPTQQPKPSGKLSKADKLRDTPLDTLPLWAFAAWWRKSIGGFQLELWNRKKLFLLIQNSLESITVLPKLPRYRGGNSLDFTMYFSRQVAIPILMTEEL